LWSLPYDSDNNNDDVDSDDDDRDIQILTILFHSDTILEYIPCATLILYVVVRRII
jgi:hypothetical protein